MPFVVILIILTKSIFIEVDFTMGEVTFDISGL